MKKIKRIFSFLNKYKKKYNSYKKTRKHILKQISSKDIEYVSFDIFDTLLVRPCIFPTDIFSLLDLKLKKKFNIDFYSIRINAEKEINNRYANIYDIYSHIKNKYSLSDEVVTTLMNEEILLETQLLSVREDVKEFYDLAVKNNKKIIAVSDMYLPSKILQEILLKNGFDKVEKIYVSNEYFARKDDGNLFPIVISDLGSKKIFHIGDNYISDCKKPKSVGIKASYYPKILDFIASNNKIFSYLMKELTSKNVEDANKNILLGFTLNNYWFGCNKTKINCAYGSLFDFGNLFLAPYLYSIVQYLCKNSLIQNNYNKIFFISRDGYLPYIVYNKLKSAEDISAEYLYASRVSYWTGEYSSFENLLIDLAKKVRNDYTFEDFLNAYIYNPVFIEKLKSFYNKDELDITIKNNYSLVVSLILKNKELFDSCYLEQKTFAMQYYQQMFSNEQERCVVFDVGYSGSVSSALSILTGKIVDKIYIHEREKNIYKDNLGNTFTYVVKNCLSSKNFTRFDLLLEECFSPLEGSCLGFIAKKSWRGGVEPLFEKVAFPIEMKHSFEQLNNSVQRYVEKMIDVFGEYIQEINLVDITILLMLADKTFSKNKEVKQLFKDINFTDKAFRHNILPLSEKI